MADWKKGGISFGLVILAALIGGLVTSSSVTTWFNTLVRPSWAPPNWIIGPIWNVLFVLMAIAFYIIWTQPDGPLKKRAMNLYLIQLGLNVVWSCSFFGLQSLLTGAIAIIVLWVFILLTIVSFRKVNRTAAWLMLPYIIWVTIAASVNFGFLALNPLS
jgi:tryptophan-rich sensory protein